MKTLSAALEALTQARVLAETPIVTITPVSNHTTPVLKAPEAFSSWPIIRAVASAASEAPLLSSIRMPVETMSHLPTPTGAGTDTLHRQVTFSLINLPYRDFATLFLYLTRDAPLDRSLLSVDLATVPPREMGVMLDHLNRIDFNLSDGELNGVFDGIIDRVVAVGDQIQCFGRTELPQVPWKLVPDDGSDRRDRGMRLPLPLGEQAIVQCVNLALGAQSSLASRLTLTDVELLLDDASAWPSSGTGIVAAEAFTWTGKTDDKLTGVVRGALGTQPADYTIGTICLEAADLILGVSSDPISSITALYVKVFTRAEPVKVSSLSYLIVYDDEATAPGESGSGITTIKIAGAQVVALFSSILADAAITRQPEYTTDALPGTIEATDNMTEALQTVLENGLGASGSWATVTTAATWTFSAGGSDREALLSHFEPGDLSQNTASSLKTVRFEFDVNVTTLGTPIDVGLSATGLEGSLQGFVDNGVVAHTTLASTGVKTIKSPIYPAANGAKLSSLASLAVRFLHGEVTSAGSPAIVFEVQRMGVTYTIFDDSATSGEIPVDVMETDTQVAAIAPIWGGAWTGTNPDYIQTRDDAAARKAMEYKISTNPVAGSPTLLSLELEYHIFRTVDAPAADSNTLVEFSGFGGITTDTMSAHNNTLQDERPPPHAPGSASSKTVIQELTVKAGATTADFINCQMRFSHSGGKVGSQISVTNVEINFTYAVAGADPAVVQSLSVELQASAGGIGLDFFAVCDGPQAPDDTYSVVSGTLLNHPSDLVRYWLQEVGGYATADVDITSFVAAVANLVGYEWGFDARNLGATFAEILLRMGYEARANIARPSGGDWKMLTANTSHSFGAAVATVNDHESLQAVHKDDSEFLTRLIVFFASDPRFENLDNRSFSQVQTTDPAAAAVIAREAEFGRRDAEPYFLLCHTAAGATGVTDWRLYMEQELGRSAVVLAGRVDHWDAYPLEIGDVVTVVTPAGSVKARVIETQADRRQGFLLRFAEAL